MPELYVPPLFNIGPPPGVLSQEEDRLELCRTNLIAFGKLFVKGDFGKTESPEFHYEIGGALLDLDEDPRQLAIFVPRGHAKSTLIKSYILHQFCYRPKDEPPRFYGWVAANIKESRRNLDYIATHVLHNKRIHRYFPHVQSGKPYGRTWNKDDIVLASGDTLITRSNVSAIRGGSTGTVEGGVQRYWRIFLDDVENEENTKTLESREYLRNTITNAVYPALVTPQGRLVYTMTPVHYDSVCWNIITKWKQSMAKGEEAEFSYRVIYYPATQPNLPGGVLWQGLFPREVLNLKRKYFEDSGNLAGYYQEYELKPQSQENRIWTRDHYKLHDASYFYDEEKRTGMLDWNGEMFPVKCFIGCDPATDIKTFNSDDSAFVVVAYDANRRLFVLETVAELSIPQLALRDSDGKILGKPGVVDILFDLYDRYHCDNATVEDVGMTRGVWQDIQAEQYRRNRYDIIVHPIEPMGQDKRDKTVAGLNSMFVQRLIHYRDDQYKLREQTEEMGPQLVHDDLIESLFFATRNLVLPNENSSILRKVGQRLHLNRNWKTL